MGLKQMISKAMAGDEEAAAALPPVQISGDALKAYSGLVRQWTGWPNATLRFEEPEVSPFASCNRKTHVVKANPERLLLNPNRVLLHVNPFRLRQEAVLTGALLHEAAHARHSNWIPRSQISMDEFKHNDGTPVTKAELSLAKTLEEARIEGIMASEADKIGATGLAWTLRASAAHLVPMTDLSADPAQALIDLIGSWALRAGRQVALSFHIDHGMPSWVSEFGTLLHEIFTEHFEGMGEDTATAQINSIAVITLLTEMCRGTDAPARYSGSMFKDEGGAADTSDSGSFMVDHARDVLTILFPETPPDQMPMSGGSCGAGEGEEGEGQGVTDIDEEGDEAGEEAGSGDEQAEGEAQAGAGAGEGTEGDEGEGTDTESPLAKALAAMEADAKGNAVAEGKAESTKPADPTSKGGFEGGAGSGSAIGGGWRMPTVEERVVKTNAERFLRDLIEPNVASKVRITDQPSSMIDGAALAAWKASGQVMAPRFFQQVKRTTKPTPPVKIAVLVDVSASMDQLQKPSALLSWALAAACLDLRNFAGGGVQIESTLIHWGSTARVIQRNGEVVPGIREVGCHDGTTAMAQAYELIEQQIPGFFDVKEQPENKLIVQFTDWKLAPYSIGETTKWVSKGLESGASLLSVVPAGYTARHTALANILANSPIQRGRNHLMHYNPKDPSEVWNTAARALA